MTRYGLCEEDAVYEAPRTSPRQCFYFCEGESVKVLKSQQRNKYMRELEELNFALREKCRLAGEHMVAAFEERLAAHQNSYQPSTKEFRPSFDELVQQCAQKHAPSTIITPKVSATSSTQKDHASTVPSPAVSGVAAPSAVGATPFSSATVKIPAGLKLPFPTPGFKDSDALFAASTSSASQSFPGGRTSLAPSEVQNIFMSTPMKTEGLPPLFFPPATAIKGSIPSTLFEEVPTPKFEATTPSVSGNTVGIQQTTTTTTPSSTTVVPMKIGATVASARVSADIKLETTKEVVQDTGSTDLPEWFSAFYGDELAFKKRMDTSVKEFESSAGSTRTVIKRTIIERITVCSKKHAPKEDILATSRYLSDLFRGQLLVGVNGQSIQLRRSEEISYAMAVTCDHYVKLVEQDLDLCDVVANILISIQYPQFEMVLVAKLMSASVLLSLNKDQCYSKCEELGKQPSDAVTFFINQQRAVVRLFFKLHTVALESERTAKLWPFQNIWRCLAFILDSEAVPLATPFVLNEMLLSCGGDLKRLYGRQLVKCLHCMRVQLVPKLEDHLERSTVLQRAGQAMHIAVLRNTIDECY